jgi:hypothetical protein
MAFYNPHAGPSSQPYQQLSSYATSNYSAEFVQDQPYQGRGRPPFDILEWYPMYQSCQEYFIKHGQHNGGTQALAAFINIQLPYQKQHHIASPTASSSRSDGAADMHSRPGLSPSNNAQSVSLIPYLRRLIVTGHDTPGVLHGFFGDNWAAGIGDLHEIERRNYMFTARAGNWHLTKQAYDMSPEETCPFLIPLRDAKEEELQATDAAWGEWLTMRDWMLGPRRPAELDVTSPPLKSEPQD